MRFKLFVLLEFVVFALTVVAATYFTLATTGCGSSTATTTTTTTTQTTAKSTYRKYVVFEVQYNS